MMVIAIMLIVIMSIIAPTTMMVWGHNDRDHRDRCPLGHEGGISPSASAKIPLRVTGSGNNAFEAALAGRRSRPPPASPNVEPAHAHQFAFRCAAPRRSISSSIS
jgi:hypothetical protein